MRENKAKEIYYKDKEMHMQCARNIPFQEIAMKVEHPVVFTVGALMHTCIHAYMHTCIHAYMHTCIHVQDFENSINPANAVLDILKPIFS